MRTKLLKILLGAATSGLIVGTLSVAPAMADAPDATDQYSSSEVVEMRADAVDAAEEVMNAGGGDKAALEAAKEFAPAAYLYCNDWWSLYPSGSQHYRIPTYDPISSAFTYNCYLESGVTGQGVYALQESLRYCYGQNIALDSDFGPATYQALMVAQRAAGTTIDGVYGPSTRHAMKWWGGGSYCKTGYTLGI